MSGSTSQTTAPEPKELKGNGVAPPSESQGNDVSKRKDDVKQTNQQDEEGLVSNSLRSPMQTRVRRISAELRLSASSNLDNIKKAGKGLCSVANKLPLPAMPKSLRRRSWHYEEVDENSLLDPELPTPREGGGNSASDTATITDPKQLGKLKSRSSDNLRKAKEEKASAASDPAAPSKSFLAKKWDARKSSNKDQENNRGTVEKNGKKVEGLSAPGDVQDESGDFGDNETLSLDAIPVVFEPLTLGPRPVTPTVTISSEEDSPTQNTTNPFAGL